MIWSGRVIIVTGGANGIGRAIVCEAAQLGAYPVIVDCDKKAGSELSQKLLAQHSKHLFIETDLTKYEQCERAVQLTISTFGKIDILINNAGINDRVGLYDSPHKFTASLNLNLTTAFSMTHYALPFMTSGGSIVNILSKVYATGQGGTSGYAASKGGLASLTREWAVDLLQKKIRVNAVVPAEVMTQGHENWLLSFRNSDAKLKKILGHIPLENRFTKPIEIAKTVLFLASDDSSHTTGQFIFVDGGYTHLDRQLNSSL